MNKMPMTKFIKKNTARNKDVIRVQFKSKLFPKLPWHPVRVSYLNEDTGSGIIVLVPHTAAFHNTLRACARGKQLFDDGAFRDATKTRPLVRSQQNTVEEPFHSVYLFATNIFANLFGLLLKYFCTVVQLWFRIISVYVGTVRNFYSAEEIVQYF